jgi:hypothetical protein
MVNHYVIIHYHVRFAGAAEAPRKKPLPSGCSSNEVFHPVEESHG